jgi:glycosyltransferase involved in cell wall biosynthesis
MTRIGMILEKKFPPDIRVEKEARALTSAGFDVVLLCRASDGQAAREDLNYGLRLYRTALKPISLLQKVSRRVTLVDEAWLEAIRQFIRDFQPDALHVHDFPLVRTALSAAKEFELPVIADLHENMPAALLVHRATQPPLLRLKDSIERNYYLWKWHEKKSLPLCERVIVVVPEAAERLPSYGIPDARISVVSNTEAASTFDLRNLDEQVLARHRDKWIISYIGSIGVHRGVDTVICAVPHLVKQIPNFLFLIVGADLESRYSQQLMQLADELGVKDHVEMIGWQPFEKVSSYVSISAACLVPHARTEHTETTVPHKLFQYMLAGKPVIVSDVRPLKRIVDETQSGLVFAADNPLSFADKVMTLHKDVELGKKLGGNGQKAADGRYSWIHDARRLVEVYEKISERKK